MAIAGNASTMMSRDTRHMLRGDGEVTGEAHQASTTHRVARVLDLQPHLIAVIDSRT